MRPLGLLGIVVTQLGRKGRLRLVRSATFFSQGLNGGVFEFRFREQFLKRQILLL